MFCFEPLLCSLASAVYPQTRDHNDPLNPSARWKEGSAGEGVDGRSLMCDLSSVPEVQVKTNKPTNRKVGYTFVIITHVGMDQESVSEVCQPVSQGLSAASGRTRETQLQKVLFGLHTQPCTWAISSSYSTEHPTDPPFLSWPLFLCLSACLLLLLCCSCSSFPTTPGACPTFLPSFFALGFPLLQWFSPNPSACLSPGFPNPGSNRVYPEQLLTVTPLSFWGPRLWLLAFSASSHSTYDLLPDLEQHVLKLMLQSLQAHQEEADLS